MPVGDEVTVPAQYGLGAYEQPDAAQHVAGESAEQRGEERPVGRGEADLLAVQLSLEDGELVAQCQDFRVLGTVAHGQQSQQRERVGHAEVRQS
jgi:hypothetical protein